MSTQRIDGSISVAKPVADSLALESRSVLSAVSVPAAVFVKTADTESDGIATAFCGLEWFWAKQKKIIELGSSFVNNGTRAGAMGG